MPNEQKNCRSKKKITEYNKQLTMNGNLRKANEYKQGMTPEWLLERRKNARKVVGNYSLRTCIIRKAQTRAGRR